MIRAAHFSAESKANNKTPKTIFFSNAGKVRLVKIWEDQRLSDDMIISSWISGGSSESIVKENVAEYMHQFMQARYNRYGSSGTYELYYPHKKTNRISKLGEGKVEPPGSCQGKLIQSLNNRTHHRGIREAERLNKSLLDGELTHTNDKDMLKHPIYRANCLEARIKNFEMKYDKDPSFCFKRTKHGAKNSRNNSMRAILPSPTIRVSSKNVTNILGVPTSHTHTSKSTLTSSRPEVVTISQSNFLEDSGIYEEQNKPEAELHNSPSKDLRKERKTHKIISPWLNKFGDEERASTPCNSRAPSSVYISPPLFNNAPWISPFVHGVLNEENTSEMYTLAEDVVWLFRRKLRVSKYFVEEVMKNITEYDYT